jgi:uncharacterized membrane protein YoaK (UPF0700 family)
VTARRARLSLYYPATYLSLTGIAFLLAPQPALHALWSTGHYESAFVRFTGAFMIALACLVGQMIRHRLDVLYPTTVAVRVFFLIVIAALYGETRDRLFIAIFVVVALGVVLTTVALLMDHLRATA